MVTKFFFTKQFWVMKKREAEEKVVKSFISYKYRRGNNPFFVSLIKNLLKFRYLDSHFHRNYNFGKPHNLLLGILFNLRGSFQLKRY